MSDSVDLEVIREIENRLIDRRKQYNISPEELVFVLEFITDLDCERAVMATYQMDDEERPSGQKLISDPRISQAIASEIAAQGERLFLKKEAILARVWAEAINPRSKPSERLKALEIAARMIGSLDFERSPMAPSVNVTITDPTFNVRDKQDVDKAIIVESKDGSS